MFRITSEQELFKSFRNLDRDQVILPEGAAFPLLVKDYLTWTEPSGSRVYLVFSESISSPPLGVVFKRMQSAGPSHARMCEWCHSVRPGEGVGMLSATVSANRRVGVYLCWDLSCKEKVGSAVPGQHDFSESLTPHQRVQKIIKRMADFARREIF